MSQQLSFLFFSLLFGIAGIAHIVMPSFFIEAMPPILPLPAFLNLVVAGIEILLALSFWTKYRRLGIDVAMLLLLIFFFTIHVWHVQVGEFPSLPGTPTWVLWLRLVLQLGLIYWLWRLRKAVVSAEV